MSIPDWRHISNGREIPTEHYSDQPFLTHTDDGAWLCVITTGPGEEGHGGQHVVSLRSTDQGRTWTAPVDVEPSTGPEASYATILKIPSGRIYTFYNHNTDNVRRVTGDKPAYPDGRCTRVDSLGYYVFKFSDDHGRTWSEKRYPIPSRAFEIDRKNADGGKLRYFWNVGRPFIHDDAVYVSLHKVGGFGDGFFTSSEGVLLRSANLLTETDPAKIKWETFPEGDIGLRTPPGGGPIAEEQSYCVLSDGSFHVVYRSTDGHPVCSYSRDQGRTWSPPRYQTYADGRLMKHPRAANFAWRLSNGRYLYWFHNHGGTWYEDRNPVWLCGGVEIDTPRGREIAWSQPEIFLYDDDTYIRMSYPDLIEDGGEVFITETQKDVARVHHVPQAFLAKLWSFDPTPNSASTWGRGAPAASSPAPNRGEGAAAPSASGPIRDGLLVELTAPLPASIPAPQLPAFTDRDWHRADYGQKDLRTGFSIEIAFTLDSLAAGQALIDTRTPAGQGLALVTTDRGTIEIILNDGRTENRWDCDPGLIKPGQRHHLVATVDAGPHVITFVVDGKHCDGGKSRIFGWGRFSKDLRDANGSETMQLNPVVSILRVYDRALMTCEAAAHFAVIR